MRGRESYAKHQAYFRSAELYGSAAGSAKGCPVFLTKNGRGCYAIMEIQEYERMQAEIKLINELNKGRRSGEEKGWLTAEQVRQHFREKANV